MKETFSPLAEEPSSANDSRVESDPAAGRVGERRLTDRETEILGLLAAGLPTSGIARELHIAPATVRNHAQRILAKLRVHSRLAAVAHGYAIGLLQTPTVAGRTGSSAASLAFERRR